MSEHSPKYLNNILVGPAVCVWPHIFQARQYKGKGDFKFDINVVITADLISTFWSQVQQLAVEAFPGGEHQWPTFQWCAVPVAEKRSSPKLAQIFPDQFILSAKCFLEHPPQVLIPNAPGQKPAYIPMPEAQRSQLVYDGAHCYITLDFASYAASSTNIGIRAQFSSVVFWGAGEHVTVGTRPDPTATLEDANLNLQMQTPAPLQQQVAPQGMPNQQVPGAIPQGMPNQPMPNQQGAIAPQGMPNQPMPGTVPQTTPAAQPAVQPAPAVQPVTPQAAPANPMAPQVAPVNFNEPG